MGRKVAASGSYVALRHGVDEVRVRMDVSLEPFWADLLSKDPARIRATLNRLKEEERSAVLDHLRRMATEDGWSKGQRLRAQAALKAIERE